MRVPVLTYHSNNISGNDYASNDHVALAEDLRTLHRLRRRIVPLSLVVDVLLGDASESAVEDGVAISFDDGSWFDWYDIEHPTCGQQRGFAGVLRDFRVETAAPVHATSFVIVSPEARSELDRTCLVGRGWWGDAWWREAHSEGVIAIESHSWDHNHASLTRSAQRAQAKGSFSTIETRAEADAEIAAATAWLREHVDASCGALFAYPYGECNAYLATGYLPSSAARIGLRAAFDTRPAAVEATSDRWRLPRFVCGRDWTSRAGLEVLLERVR